MNHHPDLAISWDTVTVTISTHSEGGLTANDFELAAKIDALDSLGSVAKRKKQRRAREKAPTVDYVDPEGNVLTLRQTLSAATIAKVGEPPAGSAASQEDAWHRRSEALFERLAVSWEIAGLPLTTRRCCWGATGWPTPRPSAGCGRRSPSTSSATSPSSPPKAVAGAAADRRAAVDCRWGRSSCGPAAPRGPAASTPTSPPRGSKRSSTSGPRRPSRRRSGRGCWSGSARSSPPSPRTPAASPATASWRWSGWRRRSPPGCGSSASAGRPGRAGPRGGAGWSRSGAPGERKRGRRPPAEE